MMGDEEEPRDVLEYLVIERHLVNPYGRWRLHGKIVPAWAPPKDPVIKVTVVTACFGCVMVYILTYYIYLLKRG